MLLLVSAAMAVPPAADDAVGLEFTAAMERMDAVLAGLKDCTFTLTSEEYVDGAMTEKSWVDIRFRREEDIYMHFTKGPNAGRMLLYRGPDWNGGKFRIDPGRFIPVMSLHPEGRLAKRGNRHTVRDVPLPRLGAKILGDATKVRDHPTWKPEITKLSAGCYETRLPKDEDATLYAYRAHICIDAGTGLPSSLKIWDHEDGAMRLVESYGYLDLVVNPGLTDTDFDPETYGL